MKTRTINRKLSLSKTTVSNLQDPEMGHIKGGHVPTWTAGDSYCAGPASCLTCVWLCNTDITCHRFCPA